MPLAHGFAVAGGALVASVWESCVLVAAVALVLRLVPGMPARARSLVWLAVMVLVVGLPFLHVGRGSGVAAGGAVRVGLGWTIALAVAWVGMSAVRAGRLVWSAWLLRGMARRARVIEVSDGVTELLGGRAVVCASDEVSVPSVAGFFAPRILLPEGIVGRLSEMDLRQILVHEMEHLKRGDDWVNLLQKVSLVVFPLNPALVWVERRLCAERELACDDAVVRVTGSAKAYASCLANLAEHTLVRRGVSLALGAWERRPELARRVTRILAGPVGEMKQARMVVAMMLVGVVGGAVGLSRVPRLVRFAEVERPVIAAVGDSADSLKVSGRITHLSNDTTVAKMGHSGSEARVVLASAVMPASVRADGVVAARKPTSQKRDPSTSSGQVVGHPVLRRVAMDEEFVGRRVLLAFDPDRQISYAAVPVRNGWLIFQL